MRAKIIHIPNLAHVDDRIRGRRRQRGQWQEPPAAAAARQQRQRQRYEQHEHDQAVGALSAEQARVRFKEDFGNFLCLPGPLAHAFNADFGAGKTTIAAAQVAEHHGYTVIFVSTLRLADEIRDKHLPQARVYRGRDADVPGDPQRKMCDNLSAVHDAYSAGLPVTETCCRRKTSDGRELKCKFYDTCAYWQQKDRSVKIWIAAHPTLFLDQDIFQRRPARVIIDEDFWQAGLDPHAEDGVRSGLDLRDIIDDDTPRHLQAARLRLGQALERRQQDLGGVDRACFAGVLDVAQCTAAIKREWRHIDNATPAALWPGMSVAERAAAKDKRERIARDRKVVRILETVRDLLALPEGTVSGRLCIEEGEHARMVMVDDVHPVLKRFIDAPVWMMSGTLPSWQILSKFFPHVETIARIKVKAPHMTIRQVYGAPVTKRKLEKPRNRTTLHAYILARWRQCGRPSTVVITNYEFAKSLRLPSAIKTEHYNNIRGIDVHKDVRLLICIGRVLPGPQVVEHFAGVLTGAKPREAQGKGGWGRWYAKRTVEIADGIELGVDWHPDPTAEAVRRQICEAELLQAIGRGRGINRGAGNPLQVEVLADVKLPVAIDEVEKWAPINLLLIMLIEEGILLLSAYDLCRLRPKRWTMRTAERALQELKRSPPKGTRGSLVGFGGDLFRLRYQPTGNGQRMREALYDPTVLPDPRSWLEKNLGAMAQVEIGGA